MLLKSSEPKKSKEIAENKLYINMMNNYIFLRVKEFLQFSNSGGVTNFEAFNIFFKKLCDPKYGLMESFAGSPEFRGGDFMGPKLAGKVWYEGKRKTVFSIGGRFPLLDWMA